MAEERKPRWTPSGEQVAGGVLAGQAMAVGDVGDRMLRDVSKATRFAAKRIPGLPGLVFDAASVHTAKDKNRAGAELAGQVLGGIIGSAGGPVGVAVGSMVGEKAAELAYDHKDDIKAWMDERWNDLARSAGQRVLPYTPIDRINRAYRR